MRQPLALFAALQVQIPEARHLRIAQGEAGAAGRLIIEYVTDRTWRCGLEESDFDRPIGDIVAEIVEDYRARRNDLPPKPHLDPSKMLWCSCEVPRKGKVLVVCRRCSRFVPSMPPAAVVEDAEGHGPIDDCPACEGCGKKVHDNDPERVVDAEEGCTFHRDCYGDDAAPVPAG